MTRSAPRKTPNGGEDGSRAGSPGAGTGHGRWRRARFPPARTGRGAARPTDPPAPAPSRVTVHVSRKRPASCGSLWKKVSVPTSHLKDHVSVLWIRRTGARADAHRPGGEAGFASFEKRAHGEAPPGATRPQNRRRSRDPGRAFAVGRLRTLGSVLLNTPCMPETPHVTGNRADSQAARSQRGRGKRGAGTAFLFYLSSPQPSP